jgi:hypothetical protein
VVIYDRFFVIEKVFVMYLEGFLNISNILINDVLDDIRDRYSNKMMIVPLFAKLCSVSNEKK